MNFDVDFPKSQDMLNEIICGYFSLWRRVSMLRESIKNSEHIHDSNNNLVCLGVKCIQETLYYSSVSDIRAWFIDSDKKVASLYHLLAKLNDAHFSNKLKAWYSTPPSTVILAGSEEPKSWHKSFSEKKREEFQSQKNEILVKHQKFLESEEIKRIAILRDKYVAHKEFKNGKLYEALEYDHKISDVESVLKLIDGFIFDLNYLFNKSTYIDQSINFDRVGEEYWSALKST
ncbi:MAG: hypothetical protein H9917_00145 [Candidatus Oceanisphaera merdipullorum]|nr:hypothetical protein [Candidatus Oceanisphaera merdipullorum]